MQHSSSYTVYSASAGSGKTFTLVREYLQILLQSDDVFYFQKILAITFTNKAAGEMKQRIIESLQDFANKNSSDLLLALQKETGLDEEVIQHKSKRIIAAILKNYSALSITTIDSFTHNIIRSFAYDFGLSMDFDIEMDVNTLLQKAVNEVISKIGEDKELTEVLIKFALSKSDEDKSWDILYVLNDFAKILLNETDKLAFNTLSDKTFNDYKLLTESNYKRIQKVDKQLSDLGKKGLQIIANSQVEENYFNRGTVLTFYKKLANNQLDIKRFQEGIIQKYFEEDKALKKKFQPMFAEIEASLWKIFIESEILIKQKALLKLFNESVVPLSVLSYIKKALDSVKEEENIKTISEFNELIFDKIQDQPAPFIYERIGEKYQHFFIDEMQDTSILQWKNLVKLIDNSLSQGGSLMLVGDAKQAIYRWRGGEAEQFIALSDTTKNLYFQVSKNVENLDTNFRSHEEIIYFTNSFFQHIAGFLQDDVYKGIYTDGNKQKTNSKTKGYVQLDFVKDDKSNEDNELRFPKKVLEIIQNLDASFQLKDVCILVRTRKQGVAVSEYLIANDVDIISNETLLLASDKQVAFLIHVLTHLQNSHDKESRLMSLDFMYEIFAVREDKHSFFSRYVHLESHEYYKALEEIGVQFDVATFAKLSLYDALEYTIRTFALTGLANVYLQYFLDEVLEYQNTNGSDLSGFLEHWEINKEKLSVSIPDGKNAVQITTIHKAKGLEFPVVIFPYDLNIYNQIDPKIWYPIKAPKFFNGFDKLLIPFRESLEGINETSKNLYEGRRKTLELDAFNLLYVALTRAEEQLYVLSDYKLNAKGEENTDQSSGLFINYLKMRNEWVDGKQSYAFGEHARNIEIKETKDELIRVDAKEFISVEIADHKVNKYQKEAILWDTDQGKAIDYGNFLHKILADIYSEKNISTTLQRYYNQNLINAEEAQKIESHLFKVVRHPDLMQYYDSNVKSYNERAIITSDKQIIIPDRLVFLPNNKVIVIDYKTGTEESSHIVQVQKYANALTDMGYVVSRKLLVYIEDEIVRVVG